MSYDSLYFTSSPSASILDPMGWTQTSYMPGRLEDPASRLAGLSGVTSSRLAPSVDAAGTWGLDTAGPDLSALYKGAAMGAATDPDALDTELLGVSLDPGDVSNDSDPISEYLRTKDTATTPSPPATVDLKKGQLVDVTGLSPGTRVYFAIPQKISFAVTADSTGVAHFKYDGLGSTNFEVYIRGPLQAGDLSVTVSGVGVSTKLEAQFRIMPAGATVVGNKIRWPSAAETAALTPAVKLFRGILHMQSLFVKGIKGDPTAWTAMKYYYSLWSNLKQSLPTIAAAIALGNQYTAATFWAAYQRLRWAAQLNNIAAVIENEANYTFRQTANLYLPKNIFNGKQLSTGTAALAGYLVQRPEVAGHTPLVMLQATDKKSSNVYEYSTYVRTRLVTLGNTIDSTQYRGNLKKQVQQGVRLAASFADLSFFFDGTADPWDPIKRSARGRELQERVTPNLPFATGLTDAENATIASLLVTIQQRDIATAVETAYRERLALPGAPVTTQADRDLILQRVRATYDVNHEVTDAIINLIRTRAFLGSNWTEGRIQALSDRKWMGTSRTWLQQLRLVLHNYIINPLNPMYAGGLTTVLAVPARQWGGQGDADVGRMLQIINTVLTGTQNLLGRDLLEDPYVAILNQAHPFGLATRPATGPQLIDLPENLVALILGAVLRVFDVQSRN